MLPWHLGLLTRHDRVPGQAEGKEGSVSEQDHASPCIPHGAYYFKDEDNRPQSCIAKDRALVFHDCRQRLGSKTGTAGHIRWPLCIAKDGVRWQQGRQHIRGIVKPVEMLPQHRKGTGDPCRIRFKEA